MSVMLYVSTLIRPKISCKEECPVSFDRVLLHGIIALMLSVELELDFHATFPGRPAKLHLEWQVDNNFSAL